MMFMYQFRCWGIKFVISLSFLFNPVCPGIISLCPIHGQTEMTMTMTMTMEIFYLT